MAHRLKTPVVLVIFKRPEVTQAVFEVIRQVKPSQLLVVADGPRSTVTDEDSKCAETRAVIDQVNWDCQVFKNFADTNLGCKQRVVSGLNWVFSLVEEAIILEDDCLPHPSFFQFCEELLEKYRHDERVMTISGGNYQLGRKRSNDSYYFSIYAHTWGWATWRRAWQYYDVDIRAWPRIKQEHLLRDILQDELAMLYWSRKFESVYHSRVDTWDYQWLLTCWLQRGLTILPSVNLVSNIGFSAQATHTKRKNKFSNLPTAAMQFPLQHPCLMLPNSKADRFTQMQVYNLNILWRMRSTLLSQLGLDS